MIAWTRLTKRGRHVVGKTTSLFEVQRMAERCCKARERFEAIWPSGESCASSWKLDGRWVWYAEGNQPDRAGVDSEGKSAGNAAVIGSTTVTLAV